MTTVAQLAEALQTLLTTTAEATARATGFVQRRSKLGGAAFVQALVFAWLANPQATVEARAQAAAVAGVAISPQGLEQRCTERAALFLEQMLAQAVRTVIAAEPVVLPLLQRFTAVVLLDSSTVVLPAALGPWWPGCGGSSEEHTQAALKLQVRFDLCRGTVEGPLLTDGRTHENTSPLQHKPLPRGALRLADLGFFNLDVFAEMRAQGVFWLSRLLLSTAVSTPDGARCDVLRLLAAHTTPTVELAVCLGATHRLPVRLLAARVPAEMVNQRRRRLHADGRRRGRTPSAAQLEACAWTLLITTAPPELLSLPEALVLARARWQIELLFKLWKSHGEIDASRSTQPWRVLCEVFAKLLAMLIQHWVLLTGCWSCPSRSLVKAAQTVRQHAFHLASMLADSAALGAAIRVIHRALAAGCRINRRKTKPNTYQLLLDPDLAGLG
ncbi:MAG: IS4 family transposase [Ktedonobacterales bacterium]